MPKIKGVSQVIDRRGYRLNVGIVLMNANGRLFLGKRFGHHSWQFPQGGVQENETPQEAMYRELYEEVGLESADVELVTETRDWLYYRLPKQFMRKNTWPKVIGQKQKWFLLRLTSDESHIVLDRDDTPEFDSWRWVDFWRPIREVIYFKKRVYRKALREFQDFLHQKNLEHPEPNTDESENA